MNFDEELTRLFRYAADALGGAYPKLIGFASFGGYALNGGIQILASAYPKNATLIGASSLNATYYIALAIFIALLIKKLMKKEISEKTIEQIAVLELLAEKASLNKKQKRHLWTDVLTRYHDQLKPDLTTGTEDFVKSIKDDISDNDDKS